MWNQYNLISILKISLASLDKTQVTQDINSRYWLSICTTLGLFQYTKMTQKQHSLCQSSAQNFNQIWHFLGKFGHYLPLKSSIFSHLEFVPAIISSFGYLYTLDLIIIITKRKIVEPFVNRKNQKSCFTYCWVVSKVRVASNIGVNTAYNLASLDKCSGPKCILHIAVCHYMKKIMIFAMHMAEQVIKVTKSTQICPFWDEFGNKLAYKPLTSRLLAHAYVNIFGVGSLYAPATIIRYQKRQILTLLI